MSNISSIPIVCLQFFNWIALCDVDIYFSCMLVRKADGVEEETK